MTAKRADRLSPKRAALLVVDVQERLVPAMPSEIVEQVIKNTRILIEAAGRLRLPIVVSEQYPKGLGQTVPEIKTALANAATTTDLHKFEKVEFSAAATPAYEALKLDRDQWIVTGMETHVCVYQTVRDLAQRPVTVHVASDAVCSRTKANWRIGLELCEELGAIVTSTEVCVFDLLERAGTDDFKALSKAIK